MSIAGLLLGHPYPALAPTVLLEGAVAAIVAGDLTALQGLCRCRLLVIVGGAELFTEVAGAGGSVAAAAVRG